MSTSIPCALRITLRGLAQIFLLRRAASGLLVLCGVLLASPALAGIALAGSASGTALAVLLGRSREEVRAGLHGYNAALAAMALHVLYAPPLLALAWAVVAATLTGVLLQGRHRWPLPAYTTPFLLVVWTVMALAPLWGLQPVQRPAAAGDELALGEGLLHGLGQVVFVQSIPAALCAALAIALESPRLAFNVLAASALGLLLGAVADMPGGALSAGLAGFNAVLCALALGPRCSLLPCLVAATGATALSLAAQGAGIPAFTGPFILCTWAVLLAVGRGR